jgi:hypothetical protein
LALPYLQTPDPSVELVIAAGVEDRQPVDPGNRFPDGTETVTAWARTEGLTETTITFVWEHANGVTTINMMIGGSPWRTWTEKSIPGEWTGAWTVRVTGTSGTLAEATFTVGDE